MVETDDLESQETKKPGRTLLLLFIAGLACILALQVLLSTPNKPREQPLPADAPKHEIKVIRVAPRSTKKDADNRLAEYGDRWSLFWANYGRYIIIVLLLLALLAIPVVGSYYVPAEPPVVQPVPVVTPDPEPPIPDPIASTLEPLRHLGFYFDTLIYDIYTKFHENRAAIAFVLLILLVCFVVAQFNPSILISTAGSILPLLYPVATYENTLLFTQIILGVGVFALLSNSIIAVYLSSWYTRKVQAGFRKVVLGLAGCLVVSRIYAFWAFQKDFGAACDLSVWHAVILLALSSTLVFVVIPVGERVLLRQNKLGNKIMKWIRPNGHLLSDPWKWLYGKRN